MAQPIPFEDRIQLILEEHTVALSPDPRLGIPHCAACIYEGEIESHQAELIAELVDARAEEKAREYHEDQCVYRARLAALPWAVENRVVREPIYALFRERKDADRFVEDTLDLRVIPAGSEEPDLGDGTAPPEENFWDDRTTPGAYSRQDSERDIADRVTRMLTRGYVRKVLRDALNAHDGSWGITNAKADAVVDKLFEQGYPDGQTPTKEAS